jgi:cardiolipin synthase (CMP-forming)
MFTIPNLLTFARLFMLIPICVLMTGGIWAQMGALALYILAAASDYADGWWARRYNAGSDFGRMFDPIVDKIFVAGLFIMMASQGSISGLWLICPIVILTREFLIAGLREYLAPKNISIPVSQLAKWKTTTQMIALGLLLVPFWGIPLMGLIVLLAATILTVITAIHYIYHARDGL